MEALLQISDQFINENTRYSELISAINNAFASSDIEVPARHHHNFSNPEENIDSTLLLMPAWNPGKEAGVKIVTVSPNNGKFDLPSIQGTYIYLDAHKGIVKAILDAKALTAKRTAATSALATSYLARKNASAMLMIGTGALASNLILAHASVRPIKKVFVWGRNFSKAESICKELSNEKFAVSAVENIEEVIAKVDIVSCATLSKTPLVLGKYIKNGQHIDLVGAYKTDMRESDDDVIKKSKVFVDTYQGLRESGDILIPLQNGIISEKDINADLFELCSNKKQGRRNDQEITCFKSVGHALEDLTAATYYYKKFKNE
jgi:ornithine cyclodeaminase